jgi:hypothetical protein
MYDKNYTLIETKIINNLGQRKYLTIGNTYAGIFSNKGT